MPSLFLGTAPVSRPMRPPLQNLEALHQFAYSTNPVASDIGRLFARYARDDNVGNTPHRAYGPSVALLSDRLLERKPLNQDAIRPLIHDIHAQLNTIPDDYRTVDFWAAIHEIHHIVQHKRTIESCRYALDGGSVFTRYPAPVQTPPSPRVECLMHSAASVVYDTIQASAERGQAHHVDAINIADNVDELVYFILDTEIAYCARHRLLSSPHLSTASDADAINIAAWADNAPLAHDGVDAREAFMQTLWHLDRTIYTHWQHEADTPFIASDARLLQQINDARIQLYEQRLAPMLEAYGPFID